MGTERVTMLLYGSEVAALPACPRAGFDWVEYLFETPEAAPLLDALGPPEFGRGIRIAEADGTEVEREFVFSNYAKPRVCGLVVHRFEDACPAHLLSDFDFGWARAMFAWNRLQVRWRAYGLSLPLARRMIYLDRV